MSSEPTLRKDFHLLPIDQLNTAEWAALCDGCNLCCFRRSYHVHSGRVHYTGTFCIMLDPLKPYGCTRYSQRTLLVSHCSNITLEGLQDPRWLPVTCAYRLRAEGAPLPESHPIFQQSN